MSGPGAMRRWETCGRAWIGLLRHVWSAGEAGLEESGPIIEGSPIMFEVTSLSWDDPILREYGDVSPPPASVRPSGSAALELRIRPELADRLGGAHGVDQLRWVVDLLRDRPWTTSAWISLAVPGEREVPQLVALSFRIRGYRLIMTAMFRSQNVLTGYQSYLPLRAVQLEVAERLGLPAGPLRVFVDLPYVCVADAEEVARVLSSLPEPNAA